MTRGKNAKKRGNDPESAGHLQTWLDMPEEKDQSPIPENEYWTKLLDFWKNRIAHYRQKARAWSSVGSHKDQISEYFRKDSDFDGDKFDDEWNEVAESLPRIGGGDWLAFYTFWKRSSRQPYPPPELGSVPKTYCDVVHHLEMLGMPRSMWSAFQAFRRAPGPQKGGGQNIFRR